MAGAGACMHGEIAVVRGVRNQVEETFFLWRGVGQLFLAFQSKSTQAALWMNQVPEEVLRDSEVAAWVLLGAGGFLACVAPFLFRAGRRRR